MSEEWRPVVGYEGLYEVSNKGNILSLDRTRTNTIRTFMLKGRVMAFGKSTAGYLQVSLSNKGVKKSLTIHRIVAMAFIPNNEMLPMINHKDENVLNNNVSNLEWCSSSYNTKYSLSLHPERKMTWENAPSRKLSNSQVIEIRAIGRKINQRELAGRYGVARQTISKILNNESYAGLGMDTTATGEMK